jgi:hypothetical protein
MSARCFHVVAMLFVLAGVAPAAAESNPGDCNGVDFDAKQPIKISRIVTAPRAQFVKSRWEDASCPADTATCRGKAYLVPGDLALTGATLGSYTCVAYQSPRDKKQIWTSGWIATSALAPVERSPARKLSDWTGTWTHTGGEITISPGKKGTLEIDGEHVYPGAQNVQTGVIGAIAKPEGDMLAFAGDGSVAFDKADAGGDCLVRMQRFGELLLVEDNSQCGGVMVTFTGLYRRKK